LNKQKKRLPFAIEVVGFGDEESVRFGTTLLGSRAIAGHDGQAMQALTDIAMLFVRCKGGISHNPAESITEADAAAGARVLLRFINDFSNEKRISA
jgi:acetylornithine deacetylase/succinyl-diaminopimelate desuccinylase-like protein